MIDLLYHATIYYKIRKFVQESDPAALTYEMVIEKAKAHEHNVLEYKDHQASHGGANSVPSYNNPLLAAHALSKDGPVAAVLMANIVANVANLMSAGTAPRMGRPVIDAKASIILKLFVVPRFQPRRRRALTKARSHRHGSTGSYTGQGKGRWQPSTSEEEDTKEAAEAESVCSDDEKLGPIRSNNYIWWRERETG